MLYRDPSSEESDNGKSKTTDEVIVQNKPLLQSYSDAYFACYLVMKTIDKFYCSECTKKMVSSNTGDRPNDPHQLLLLNKEFGKYKLLKTKYKISMTFTTKAVKWIPKYISMNQCKKVLRNIYFKNFTK